MLLSLGENICRAPVLNNHLKDSYRFSISVSHFVITDPVKLELWFVTENKFGDRKKSVSIAVILNS